MKSMFFGSAAKTMFTIVVVLLVGVAGIAIAYGAGALGGSGGGASPSPTAVASAAVPTAASTPSPDTTTAPADATFVARPVTTGPGIPTAMALSDATLASAGSGWVLTVYDSGTYDAARNPILGTRILYLISPTGDLYDAGAFSASQNVDLAAWNVSQGKALLEFDGGHYAVYNLALGTLGATWSLCGDHPVTAFITARDDGAWGFRGSCVGAQVDGVYDDSGADVTPPDYYRAPFARWDVDLGDGGVAIWQPDSPNLFIVTYPAPSEPVEMHLPTGVDGCRPVGLGRPGTVLASCTSGGAVSAWELDTSGLPPTQVASSSALTFYMAHGGGEGPRTSRATASWATWRC